MEIEESNRCKYDMDKMDEMIEKRAENDMDQMSEMKASMRTNQVSMSEAGMNEMGGKEENCMMDMNGTVVELIQDKNGDVEKVDKMTENCEMYMKYQEDRMNGVNGEN